MYAGGMSSLVKGLLQRLVGHVLPARKTRGADERADDTTTSQPNLPAATEVITSSEPLHTDLVPSSDAPGSNQESPPCITFCLAILLEPPRRFAITYESGQPICCGRLHQKGSDTAPLEEAVVRRAIRMARMIGSKGRAVSLRLNLRVGAKWITGGAEQGLKELLAFARARKIDLRVAKDLEDGAPVYALAARGSRRLWVAPAPRKNVGHGRSARRASDSPERGSRTSETRHPPLPADSPFRPVQPPPLGPVPSLRELWRTKEGALHQPARNDRDITGGWMDQARNVAGLSHAQFSAELGHGGPNWSLRRCGMGAAFGASIVDLLQAESLSGLPLTEVVRNAARPLRRSDFDAVPSLKPVDRVVLAWADGRRRRDKSLAGEVSGLIEAAVMARGRDRYALELRALRGLFGLDNQALPATPRKVVRSLKAKAARKAEMRALALLRAARSRLDTPELDSLLGNVDPPSGSSDRFAGIEPRAAMRFARLYSKARGARPHPDDGLAKEAAPLRAAVLRSGTARTLE